MPDGPRNRAPRAPGFVDLLPGEAAVRRRLEATIASTFDRWGYELVGSPSIELLDTVELGVQGDQARRLFKFADGDGRLLALVGERTVSVARLVAGQLQHAPRPLRLCYLGPTFTGSPGAPRREALQAGAELVGAPGPVADAEVISLAIHALAATGLDGFQAEVGHVGFFGGLVEGLQPEQRAGVRDALAGRDLVELEAALAGTELGRAERDLLLEFPAMRGGPEILDLARGLVTNSRSEEAVSELAEIFDLLTAHGVAGRVNLDLGAIRDFDYYTGPIFEIFAAGVGVPVAAGGRYDNLLLRFGEDLPATGVVLFVDRLQGLVAEPPGTLRERLVIVGFADAAAPALAFAADLRAGGRRVLSEAAAVTEQGLRRRAREVAADEVVLVDAEGSWILDGAGRSPVTAAEMTHRR